MRSYLVIILFVCFSNFLNSATAQQQLFKNYTVNDALVSNNIRKVFQDSNGFIWIATLEGLSKYDGYTFTNYTTSNGLSHNMVNDFYESKDGTLYVALNDGSIDKIIDDKVISGRKVSAVAINRLIKTPWKQVIATSDRNGLQNFSNGRLKRPQQDLPQATFFDIAIINDTSFIVTSENFVFIFDKNYKLLAKIREEESRYSEIKVYVDKEKRIWIVSTSGLKILRSIPVNNNIEAYETLPKAFDIPSLRQGNINDMLEDNEGNMWFATSTGVVKISAEGSQQIITVKDGLSSDIVTSIFQDSQNSIWFGTALGLSKFNVNSGITLYPLKNGVGSNDNMYMIYQLKKNEILVGTSTGVHVLNTLTGNFSTVKGGNDFYFNMITAENPHLVIGVNGIATFDTVKMEIKTAKQLPVAAVSRVVRDEAGNFFMADLSSLFFSSGKKVSKILNDRVSALLIDKKGNVWVGTWENGLFLLRYTTVNGNIRYHIQHLLPSANVRSLSDDSKGNVWIGTRYSGVYRLSKNENDNFTFLHLDQSNGLTSNFIKTIREDRAGNFWIAFYHGLDKLIPVKNSFRVFNYSKINNYFSSVIGLEIDSNNNLWLATREGVVKIKDGNLEKLPPLPVYITRMTLPDSTYSPHAKKFQFGFKENDIQFEYSSPGYINEKQILYSYLLSGGHTTTWSKASNQHTVSYSGLQPGSYQFKVRSLGWNGVWGVPAVVGFTITPPFWSTWWFVSILVFCSFLLLYIFIKWRIKNIQIIGAEKLKVQQLSAEHYKTQLELEQIINYFSSSLIDKNTVSDVLWDVAKNLIGRLGFVDCIMYLWNDDKTKMIQKAGFGPKGSVEEISKQHFDVLPGQGIVGHVIRTKEAVLVPDTSQDKRYRPDEMTRLSEITVPIIYNKELIGIIDCEHHLKNFFTGRHLQILNTIATLVADKIKSIEAEQSLLHSKIELYSISEQLSKARLEALRSQMNPHFIFNCINSIDALIQSNDKYNATVYLNKFAKLLRGILDSSRQNTVSLANDLETLKLYIELEQFRHEDKFVAEVKADQALLDDDYKVPPLIIQPFVENAILHGLRYRSERGGRLYVSVTKKDNYIQYMVEDNGVGRSNGNRQMQKNTFSYGIDMTNERIRLFNKEHTPAVQITDLFFNGKAAGTKVEVYLKAEEY